jgi:hypothetical protein
VNTEGMQNPTPTSEPRLSDLPLWRLLVALDDAERTVGADSSTARVLARLIQERLRQGRNTNPPPSKKQEVQLCAP